MTSITQTSFYTFTCKVCDVVRKALLSIFIGMIALGESAGRARAANELARQGYYKEAKALMLQQATKESKDEL